LFYIKAGKEIKSIEKKFNEIKTSNFNELEYESIKSKIGSFKRLSFYIVARKVMIEAWLKFFKIKTIVGTHEHDSKNKSIFEEAQRLNIKTFGIQHGVIHKKHMHYCFSKFDASYHPFPDFTFVWGTYWKNGLTSFSNYSPKSLLPVGQIRTDIIPILNSNRDKIQINELSSDKFTLLYASQPLYVGEEKMRERLTLDFLRLTVEFPTVNFVVKPHPKESDCELYFNQQALKTPGAKFTIIREDLYKMLALCDTVLIYNSTVGAEAIYFKKPLIVMNYSSNDFSGFVSAGVAIESKSYESLVTSLIELQNSKKYFNDSADNFISDRAHLIDGKVSERIFNQIVSS
jgi:hypothetical protein